MAIDTNVMTSNRQVGSLSSDDAAENTHFVLGGEHVALAVAERLQTDGHAVTVVDETYDSDDVPGVKGPPTDVALLGDSGVDEASTVVVGTRSDSRNLLIARLVRAHFDVARTVVLVNDPERLSLLAEAGHEPVCVTSLVSEAVRDQL